MDYDRSRPSTAASIYNSRPSTAASIHGSRRSTFYESDLAGSTSQRYHNVQNRHMYSPRAYLTQVEAPRSEVVYMRPEPMREIPVGPDKPSAKQQDYNLLKKSLDEALAQLYQKKGLEDLVENITDRAVRAEREVARLKVENRELTLQMSEASTESRDEAIHRAVHDTELRLLAEYQSRILELEERRRRLEAAKGQDLAERVHDSEVRAHLEVIIGQLRAEIAELKSGGEEEKSRTRAEFELAMSSLRAELEAQYKLSMEIAVHEAEDRKLAEYREKLARKKEKLKAARAEHTTDEEHIKALEAQIEELHERLHHEEEDVEQLKKKLEHTTSRNEQLEEALAKANTEMRGRIRELEEELASSTAITTKRIKELEAELALKEQQLRGRIKRVEELESELEALKHPPVKVQLGGKGGFPARRQSSSSSSSEEVKVEVKAPAVKAPEDNSGTFIGAVEGKNDWARASGREGGNAKYQFGDATRSIFKGRFS